MRWQSTVAETLLKWGLDVGRHLDMPPRKLQETGPEHAPCPGKVFRDHVHQELRARKEPCWMARRKEKEEEKREGGGEAQKGRGEAQSCAVDLTSPTCTAALMFLPKQHGCCNNGQSLAASQLRPRGLQCDLEFWREIGEAISSFDTSMSVWWPQ